MTSIVEQTIQRYEAITGKTFEADSGAVKEHTAKLYGQLAVKTAQWEPANAPENHLK